MIHIKDPDSLKIFSGRQSADLALKICSALNVSLGASSTSNFPDGETLVTLEEDVRGRDCYIILSTCTPVNDNLMELLIFCDCLRRASANNRYFHDASPSLKTDLKLVVIIPGVFMKHT
jgi:ribose-phosphate pyrophosphokinase